MSFKKPPKLFIAYAHKDKKLKNELAIRLEPLKQEGKIEVWHDGKLIPGDKWRKVRDSYLHDADVVLYLASADSLASDECNKEIADALDNQKRFVPIILRECDWRNYEIGKSSITDFQALPKDGKPIKSWRDKDKAWQDVIDEFRKILDSAKEQEDTPQSILFKSGNVKYMLGAFNEALEDYTKAIELEPDNARTYNNRGNLFRELEQYDKAEADYNKAIELEPDLVRTYNNRGSLFRKLEQYDKAEADYNKAIELEPENTRAYNNRGNLFRKLEQYDKAEADYNKAIELEPDLVRTYNNRGSLFRKLEQYDKAEADYNKAIELEPENTRAYNNRGNLFRKLEQYDKAEADYNKVIELEPDHVNARHNRAISMANKNAEEAQEKYEKEIERILKPITSLIDHAERINEREKNYKTKLIWLDIFIVVNGVLILFTIISTGYYLLKVIEIQSPFTITAIVFAALAMALPLLWYLRNSFERRRVLQICIEDYWRKQMLTSLALSMENSDVKQYLVIETHQHFMNNSTADLLSDLLAPRNSKKTQYKEMEPLDVDRFTKIIKQVVNRENK